MTGRWPRGTDLLAIIPAFNEAGRIRAVIDGLSALGLPMLVVDDGSSDGTAAVARASGVPVLVKANGGKGTAILAGCRWAVANAYARVLLIDGDGQHDPREARWLIAAAFASRPVDMVIGRRQLRIDRQPLHRRAFNRLSSLAITWLSGQRIIDSQSGFRLFDPRLLLAMPIAGTRYDLESEMCIHAGRSGLRVREVPISVIYNDKRSGVHPLYDTARFFLASAWAVMAHRPWQRRVPRPDVAAAAPSRPAPSVHRCAPSVHRCAPGAVLGRSGSP